MTSLAEFKKAYLAHVAVADKETLDAFMDAYLEGGMEEETYEKFSDVYGSIMDALGMWHEGILYGMRVDREAAMT